MIILLKMRRFIQNMKNVELLKAINIMWIYLSVIMLIWQGYSLFLWKENWIQIWHCYTNMAKSYKVIKIFLRKSNIIEEVNENENESVKSAIIYLNMQWLNQIEKAVKNAQSSMCQQKLTEMNPHKTTFCIVVYPFYWRYWRYSTISVRKNCHSCRHATSLSAYFNKWMSQEVFEIYAVHNYIWWKQFKCLLNWSGIILCLCVAHFYWMVQ